MPHKILFAINHKNAEELITDYIKPDYVVVDTVLYRDAILEAIEKTGADTLLVRESLAGSINFETLLNRIRVEYPDVRIIVICVQRPKKDPFLQKLVNLGIYDIINSDSPNVKEIASYIVTPRKYRDAAQYGIGLSDTPAAVPVSPPEPSPPAPHSDTVIEQTKKKTRNFFSEVAKGFAALKKTPPDAAEPSPAKPDFIDPLPYEEAGTGKIDVGLLRDSIRESEARKAQSDLDHIIKEAVTKQTAALLQENKELRKKIETAEMAVSVAESHASSSIQDLNTLRAERDNLAMALTDARKEIQQTIDLYESQIRALHNPVNTPEWYSEQSRLWEEQKSAFTARLEDKTREAAGLALQCESLTAQIQDAQSVMASLQEKAQKVTDMQLNEKNSEELIARLRRESSEANGMKARYEKEIERLNKELETAKEGGPDYSAPLEYVPLLPDDTVYTVLPGSPKTILMLGAKHGTGTTTLAMNLAASLAGQGFKTLLMEINGAYPVCNQYFEFTHIPYGLEEAINDIAAGEIEKADRAIIRPHGLRPTHGNLGKTYKKLPAGLHFLLPSNKSLINRSFFRNPMVTESTIYTLLNYLSKRQQYGHIILDVQCDDFRTQECLLNSGYPIDKMCVVLTQDTHAAASAGILISNLARSHASSLVAGGEFVINRYNPNAPVTSKKIEHFLHISASQIYRFSEDTSGYLAANHAGIPYLLNKGSFWMEHDKFRSKICPSD